MRWKRDVGCLTYDLLKDRQTYIVAQFLIKKVLRFTQEPSQREIDQEDLDKVRRHLPYGYVLPKDFSICCARFRRFITWNGDILKIKKLKSTAGLRERKPNYLSVFIAKRFKEDDYAKISSIVIPDILI